MSSLIDACAEWSEEFHVQKMSEIDRAMLAKWINRRIRLKSGNWQLTFPDEMLPYTGLACWKFGRLLAVATCYLEMTSSMAVCGWCGVNPECRLRTSYEAVRRLLAAMPGYAKECGARYLMTTFGNRAINRMLDRMGFTPGETMESKFFKI